MSNSHSVKSTICLLSIMLCFFFSGCGLCRQPNIVQTRHDKWTTDIDFLAKELPKRHKNLFFQLDRGDFHREIERLKEQVDHLTDEELTVGLTRLVASVGDGHTMVYPDFRLMYPLRLYWFEEGIYAFDASTTYQEIINLRLNSVNGIPVADVLAMVRDVVSCDNEAGFKYFATTYMVIPWVLRGLGITDSDEITLGFTDDYGQSTLVTMQPQPVESIEFLAPFSQVARLPLYMRNPGLYYWYEYLPEQRTMYFQYNVCANMQVQSFKAFTDALFDCIDHNQVEKLVVDIRNNGGGNSLVMSPFISRIKQSTLNDAARLFVIIGRRTFSSALLNALDLKENTEATFVGEPTGGKPNHYGEVRTLSLPNTGLTVGYSTKYFRHSQIDTDSLEPDILIEPRIAALVQGRDPVMDWIMEH